MSERKRVGFVELGGTEMTALRDGDLAAASATAGVTLPGYFVTERALWLWRYRLGQIEADPDHAPWAVRYAVVAEDGEVVGHAGFHGPPDGTGTVEVGYAVVPAFRRRGYARAALAELLRRAAAAPDVRTVRASVSPDNAASLATLAGFGFVGTGGQWDDEDGYELVFEAPAHAAARG